MAEAIGAIHWTAALLGAVAYFALGAIWFGPLFGNAYDRALGYIRTPDQKWPLLYYVGPFVSSCVVAVVTAALSSAVSVRSYPDAVGLGALVGVGYSLPVSFNNAINPKTPRPLLYGAVTGSYHLAGAIVIALVVHALG